MPQTPDGRTLAGRFAPGNRHGRGNPVARRMAEIRGALLDAAAPEKAIQIINKMGELAAEGDTTAARIWLEYAVGKPAQALELSGPDGEPLGVDWERLQAVLMGALGRFPDARVAVAVALRGLADDSRDAGQPGDGSRSRADDGGSGADPGPLATPGSPLDG